MTERHLVIVDCETSGLRAHDIAVEVAWRDLNTGEYGRFIPPHNPFWVLRHGDPVALELNGYRQRIPKAPQDNHGVETSRLYAALVDNTLAGSNPAFDARHLQQLFTDTLAAGDQAAAVAPWHHRMVDLAAYAAGVLGLDPREIPGLAAVCERLSVDPPDHTADGDVRAVADCFAALAGVVAARRTIAVGGRTDQ